MAKIAMGQRPANSFEKPLVGLVDIITGDNRARLTLTEEGKKFKNGTNVMEVILDDLPKVPRILPNVKVPKQYRVRMSQDGTEVDSISPAKGIVKMRLTDLGKRPGKGEDPMPYEKEGKFPHLEFFAVYVVTEGAYKGVQLPAYYLHYKFEEDPENEGYARFAGNFDNLQSTRLFQLRDWGLAHDLWSDPIPWDDDTILPVLLDRALESDVEVTGVIKNGYINEVIVDEAEENPYGEEEEEVVAPVKVKKDTRAADVDELLDGKKNGKKSAKKPAKAVLVADDDDDL